MNFEFETRTGELVEIEVHGVSSGRPMAITGWGFGDAEPPEPAEYDFTAYALDPDTGERASEFDLHWMDVQDVERRIDELC